MHLGDYCTYRGRYVHVPLEAAPSTCKYLRTYYSKDWVCAHTPDLESTPPIESQGYFNLQPGRIHFGLGKFCKILRILKKFLEFLKNSQNSQNFLRFSNCVPIKTFWGKFSEICPASCTKIFVWKFLRFSEKIGGFKNSQIFDRKFLRTQIFVYRIKPWSTI